MKKILFLMAAALVLASCSQANAKKESTAPEQTETAKLAPVATLKTLDSSIMGEDIVKAAVAEFEGKVVLVDFWATWCPPCRQAMKLIDEIKPELKEKGCVFVYLTGETSPIDKFNEMYPNIDGTHYRLSKAQWESMLNFYGARGIPFYLLIGKDGKVVTTSTGYPGNDIIKNQMEVELTK